MSRERYGLRLMEAAEGVLQYLEEDEQEFTPQEIMSILDAARFSVMENEMQEGALGDDLIDEAGGEPEEIDLQRWEDDGGSVL